MAGSPSASLRPPGTGDREAGGGARAPKAAAKRLPLRRRPAQAVAALPCPSPRHRPVVRAFSANGAGRIRRPAGSGWKSPPRRPRTTIQGCPGLDARAGVPRGGGGAVQTLGRRWAPPVVPVKGELRRGRLAGAEARALSSGYETLDFDQLSPSVAETEQVSDFCERNNSTGTIGSAVRSCSSRAAGPSR